MTQYIKKVKFNGTLKDFENQSYAEYERGNPTQAFITDVLSEDGKIRKSFYWLQKYPANLCQGDQGSFELKYDMTIGG